MSCGVAGWLGVAVVQASRGAPVEKERAGPTQEASSSSTATRALILECVLQPTCMCETLAVFPGYCMGPD